MRFDQSFALCHRYPIDLEVAVALETVAHCRVVNQASRDLGLLGCENELRCLRHCHALSLKYCLSARTAQSLIGCCSVEAREAHSRVRIEDKTVCRDINALSV